MATVYYENDADKSLIQEKTIGVIGYGSQGHAHAQNLKDSGLNVIVGLYEGSGSWSKAEEDGFSVAVASQAAKESDIVVMLAPRHLTGRGLQA